MSTARPLAENATQSRSDVPYYVRGLALGLSAFLIAVHFWTWFFTAPIFIGGRADFRQLYTAGYMVRTGHGDLLYDYDAQHHFQNEVVSQTDLALPFIRPAYEALMFAPLSLMPYRLAYFVFLGINLILLAVCYLLLRSRMENLARIYRWLPGAMFLAFLPVAAALIQGQDSILYLTLFAAAFVLLERKRQLAAGLVIGITVFKFQITLPFVFLLLIRRQVRFVAGVAIGATVATVTSIWLTGFAASKAYVMTVVGMGAGLISHPHVGDTKSNLMANIHGLVFGLAGGHVSGATVLAMTAIFSVIALCVAAICSDRENEGEAFLIAMTASALVSYYLLIHDLSLMFIPIALTLNTHISAESTGDASGRLLTRTAALMFVAPICESYIPDHFYVVALPLTAFFIALSYVAGQRSSMSQVTSRAE